MKILNSGDILETIEMLTAENLDVRTVTMGISLLDCIDPDGKKACEKIYNKITRLAGNLVPVVNKISADRTPTPCGLPKRWMPLPRRSASTLSAVTVLWCIRAFPPAMCV